MEVPALPRRDRERLARRRAMLDAAVAVFAEKGYAAATVDEIAERAEFGKGTLYNYFADKQALLFAVFDEAYDGLVAAVEVYFDSEAAESERPPREVFRGLIAALLRHFAERLPTFLVLVKEAQRLVFDAEPSHVAYLSRHRERVAAAIEGPVRVAMEAGALRRLDAHAVAHILMGNVHGYLMYAACCPDGGPPPRSTEEAADLLATILLDGLLPR